MTSLQIEDSSIPSLTGKVAVITGGSSGIGYAAASILAKHSAKVFILDLNPPRDQSVPSLVVYKRCDVTIWTELSSILLKIGRIDMVFANAGISENEPFLLDEAAVDGEGRPLEPTYPVLDVNLRPVLNIIKLSRNIMKDQKEGGSIVLTASSTAYAPEICIPLYSALKLALVGLVRSLRPILPSSNITINAVAPGATETPLLQGFLAPLTAAHLPISTADFVGLALVYSATAQESYRTDVYGKDKESDNTRVRRWNGKVIMTLGNRYTELEGPLAELRPVWLGKENDSLIKAQQAETDFRGSSSA